MATRCHSPRSHHRARRFRTTGSVIPGLAVVGLAAGMGGTHCNSTAISNGRITAANQFLHAPGGLGVVAQFDGQQPALAPQHAHQVTHRVVDPLLRLRLPPIGDAPGRTEQPLPRGASAERRQGGGRGGEVDFPQPLIGRHRAVVDDAPRPAAANRRTSRSTPRYGAARKTFLPS